MVLCRQPGSEGPLAQSRGSGAHTASPGSTAARGLQPQLLPGCAATAGAGLESSCVSPGPGRFRAGWQQDRPGHSVAHGMSSSLPHARDTLPLPCPALSTAQRANPACSAHQSLTDLQKGNLRCIVKNMSHSQSAPKNLT